MPKRSTVTGGGDRSSPSTRISAYSPGEWVKFPPIFLWIRGFTAGDAIILAMLVSMWDRAVAAKKNKDGWFYYTSKKLQLESNLSVRTQAYSISKMEEMNILERRRTPRGRRHFRINEHILEDVLEDARFDKKEKTARLYP